MSKISSLESNDEQREAGVTSLKNSDIELRSDSSLGPEDLAWINEAFEHRSDKIYKCQESLVQDPVKGPVRHIRPKNIYIFQSAESSSSTLLRLNKRQTDLDTQS